MATNDIKTRGQLKSTNPKKGGAVTLDYPVIGIVKDNIDPTRSGRIKVQIEGSTAKDSDDSSGWYTVQYLSTYFGMVRPTAGQDNNGDYVSNPSSYGQWQSPPDIGTEVVCIFVEGDPNRGFYIGAVVNPEALQMVPAIGTSDNVIPNEGESEALAGAARLPVTNINTNNRNKADSTDYLDAPKPVHSYSASIMSQQGIIRDPIRGPISSSASREPMSRVGWGVATPGRPIFEGGYDDENLPNNLSPEKQAQLKVIARRGGHSIVMDDGDIVGRDQLVRIRTALGHQILMSDDGQTLMILHSNGQSYIELGKEGTVDIYSTNSINMRTQGDLNLHADQHINIHAAENLNLRAKNIHYQSEEEFKIRSGKNLNISSMQDTTVKSKGAIALHASGEASLLSSATTFINGSRINLNTGKPGKTPAEVPEITIVKQADTLFDEKKGFTAAPGKLSTITSRAPAHYPWANAGQGVNVKTSNDASKNLPPNPSPSVAKANNSGIASGAKPPALATVASAPDAPKASTSLDKNVTSSIAAASATETATGPDKIVVSKGAAITDTSGTKSLIVGNYGQNATQLVTSGVLKPGSATLIDGLSQTGSNVNQIMSSSLFTGKPGAENLQSLLKNTDAQTTSLVTNLQKSQTVLGKVGVISGKEAPAQIAGLALVGCTSPELAVEASKGISLGDASKIIGVGVAAAYFAQAIGGNAGINDTVAGVDKNKNKSSLKSLQEVQMTKGPEAAAFMAVTESLKPLKPGVPQIVSADAKEQSVNTAMVETSMSGQTKDTPNKVAITDLEQTLIANTPSGIVGDQILINGSDIATNAATRETAMKNAINDTNGIVGGAVAANNGNMAALSGAASAINTGSNITKAALVASGAAALPGQLNALGSVINNSDIAIDLPAGTQVLNNTVKNARNAVTNTTNNIQNALKDPGGLTKTLQASLPIGAAVILVSKISSLGIGKPGKIKSPTIGMNTFDRTGITTKIKNILGNPKIPVPTLLGEIKPEAITKISQRKKEAKEKFEVFNELEKWDEKIEDAYRELYDAENNFPAGDSNITLAREKLETIVNDPEYLSLKDKERQLFGGEDTRVQTLASNTDNTLSDTMNTLNTLNTNGITNSVSSLDSQIRPTDTNSIESIIGTNRFI